MNLFITVEGLDGCGKTTFLEGLVKRYNSTCDGELVDYHDPANDGMAGDIRNVVTANREEEVDWRTQLMLYTGARLQLSQQIETSLLTSDVICSRWYDSTFALQCNGDDDKNMVISELLGLMEVRVPDLTFVIDIDVKTSRARMDDRKLDYFESKGDDFHENVREHFLQTAAIDPNRVKVLDGFASPEDVVEQAWQHILNAWLDSGPEEEIQL